MHHLLRAAFVLIVCVLSTGFFVQSENSLSEPSPSSVDQRLVGKWHCVSASGTHRFTVKLDPEADKLSVDVFRVEKGLPRKLEMYSLAAWAVRIEGRDYLNLQWREGFYPLQKEFFFAIYAIGADGVLAVRLMDSEYVIGAIRSNRLSGHIQFHNGWIPILTATRQELLEFLSREQTNLLFPKATFRLKIASELAEAC